MANLRLSAPQGIFLNDLGTKYRAYVGGYGSGKTFVGCLDLLIFFSRYPGTVQGYFGPTYPSIRDIFYPTFEEAAHLMGFRVEIREGNKEVHVYRKTTQKVAHRHDSRACTQPVSAWHAFGNVQ